MNYQQLREKAQGHRAAIDEMEQMCTRDWLLPDKTLVTVRINPSWPGDAPVSINVQRWYPQPESTVRLRSGELLEGGYHDYIHDAHRVLTSQQLRWLALAREVVEAWVAGGIAELPHKLTF